MQRTAFLITCKPLHMEFQTYNKINIKSEEFTIGRDLNSTLVIPFASIKCHHCKIIKSGNNWILEDYSISGVNVNGMQLGKGKRRQLINKDIITLDLYQVFVYKFVIAKVVPLPTCICTCNKLQLKPKTTRMLEVYKKFKAIETQIRQAKEQICLISHQNAQKPIEIFGVTEREIELPACDTVLAQNLKRRRDEHPDEVVNKQENIKNGEGEEQSDVRREKQEKITNGVDENELCKVESRSEASTSKTITEFGDLMESELQCSVCRELLVCATILNCSHTFCEYCITKWRETHKQCPICRANITNTCHNLILDSFVEKMVEKLSTNMKQKRKDMLQSHALKMSQMITKALAELHRRNTRRRRRS